MKALFHAVAIIFATAALPCAGQSIKGKVLGIDENGERSALPFATVAWLGTTTGTNTNENGIFQLDTAGIVDRRVVASFIGYSKDTVAVGRSAYLTILLHRDATALKEVVVKAERPGAFIDRMSAVKTEVITQKELAKGACCDLAGCFGTQASVQSQTTNVVTNTKELRVLGISGVYNQVLFDGQPMFIGLPFTYGISSLPGTVVENIYVAKGSTSILQGAEGISGQINVEPRMPDRTDRLFANAYVNTFGERHLNLNAARPIGKGKKWSTLLALHTVQPAGRFDRDADTFMDLPQLTRYMVYNRWKYGNERAPGFFAHIGMRFWNEARIGGQMEFQPEEPEAAYGQTVDITQPELLTKLGYRFTVREAVVLSASAYHQDQRSRYGRLKYAALQSSMNMSVHHELEWAGGHLLKYGISYRYQDLEESIAFADTADPRTYAGIYRSGRDIPGAFAENAFKWLNDRVLLIVGARVDRHQRYGTFFTPRTMLKYQVNEQHILRASVGAGWRQVELFSENINLMASSRDVRFISALGPEQAITWGVDHTMQLKRWGMKGTVNLDFYQTRFQHQFYPDYDSDPTLALIDGTDATAVSNAFQVDVNMTLREGLGLRLAYNYLDVQRTAKGVTRGLPFIPTNRLMAAITYNLPKERWQFDANAHWYDQQHLPSTSELPEQYSRPAVSKPYSVLNAQITYRLKAFEFYGGCENIFDFRQLRPIIGWQDPFGPYFDTSSVWGPTIGREGYIGVRWRLK